MSDAHPMRRAIELAERGRGRVEPNPLVGAVLVRDGVVVGEGWHAAFGGPHAEVDAIRSAGDAARGADLYVTLEPCCHHGKTPPCTDAVLRAGIARVFAALEDPFPAVAGRGAQALRTAGVPVTFGLEADAARRQNAPYLTLLAKARPHVHGKWAMSLDGKIATRTGDSRWITGPAARRVVHELRGRMDAIVVGVGTALADDPELTARPPGPRTPVRVVLDRQARVPLGSRVVASAHETPTLVVASPSADAERLAALEVRGCETLRVPDLGAFLREAGRRRWSNLLVEGGGQVLGSFLDADAIDEAHVFVAPALIGGTAAPTALAGAGAERLAQALRFAHQRVVPLDPDIYVHAWRDQ